MAWWDCGETIAAGAAGCLGAYQSVGAANYAASLLNIADPGTNDLTPINTAYWSPVSGWFFAWPSANRFRLNTGIPMTEGRSAIVRVVNRGVQPYTSMAFGAGPGYSTSGPRLNFFRYATNLIGTAGNNTGAATDTVLGAVQNVRGVDSVMGFSGNGRYYLNGAFALAARNYVTPFTTDPCFIGASNPPGGDHCDGWVAAAVIYDKILSDEEQATIGAAMAALPWVDDEVPAHTTPRIIYVSGA